MVVCRLRLVAVRRRVRPFVARRERQGEQPVPLRVLGLEMFP